MNLASDKTEGNAALAYTLTPGQPYHFDEARLTLKNSASETVEDYTMTLDSTYGSAFDVLLFRQDMNGVQDLHVINTEETRYLEGDSIVFAWTNTNSYQWGLEVRWLV